MVVRGGVMVAIVVDEAAKVVKLVQRVPSKLREKQCKLSDVEAE